MYTQNQIKRRLSTSTGIENMKQLDGDHGRIETRSVRLTNEIGWLKEIIPGMVCKALLQ